MVWNYVMAALKRKSFAPANLLKRNGILENENKTREKKEVI